jgi:3-hydroxyisobutyrate dehydrogenase-like beta-hydroxyacid dehydrogenase
MSDASETTVGFIGIGSMGAPIAANLRKAGFRLVVNDTRREAAAALEKDGAIWADTPAALAARCDVVFTCLPSLAAIESVVLGKDGILAGARPGLAYFELSTNSLELAKRLHAACAECGVEMLEAPISGGAVGAARGKLAIWAGGDKATFQRFEHVLRGFSDRPRHLGAFGAGLVAKLTHNCTSAILNAALGETFTMAIKAGADPLSLFQAVREGVVGRRRTFDVLADQYLSGAYEPTGAALRILYKDVLLATEAAREMGVPMPMAQMAFADLQIANQRGWSERDRRSTFLLQQERAGLSFPPVPRADLDEVFRQDPPAPTDNSRA